MEKRTTLDRIEIEFSTGNVFVRFLKQVVEDNGTVVFSEPHRTVVGPTVNIREQMALVNKHLVEEMGYPACDEANIAMLESFIEARNPATA